MIASVFSQVEKQVESQRQVVENEWVRDVMIGDFVSWRTRACALGHVG